MVLYSRNSKVNRGVAKLGYSDHLAGSGKGESLNRFEQIMDIERYFAAFPALEKTVPSCLKKATNAYISHTAVDSQAQSADQFHSVNGDAVQSPIVRLNGRGQNSKAKRNVSSNKPSPPKSASHKQYRAAGKHHNPSYRKTNYPVHARNGATSPLHRNRKPKQLKVSASKPWKQMSDVPLHLVSESPKRHKIISKEREDSATHTNGWMSLSSDALEEILLSDSCFVSQSPTHSNQDYNIWSNSSENDLDWPSIFSQHDSSGEDNREDECISKPVDLPETSNNSERKDMSKSWADDYKEIENQMAHLMFCEDLDDGMSGSRFLKYFGDNSLSYMIRNSTFTQVEANLELVNSQHRSCKHCEQSYEVILESESAPSKAVYRSDILTPVDSQLNFDWTKYDPPPWSSYSEETDTEPSKSSKSIGCDCEFCRSRIWRKVCRWCATPL